jgi:hypothetical protein
MTDELSNEILRIWKHSHGKGTQSKRDALRERSVITIHRDTGTGQGSAFRTEMSVGDFFYLTHGNDVQLFGQISSDLKKAQAKWVEREYITIRTIQRRSGHFTGSPRWWAPNANKTCIRVPRHHLGLFEKQVLIPYFRLRLRDLERMPWAIVAPRELDGWETPTGVKYKEASQRLVRHKELERVRNQKLVSDAKRAFKRKHGKLFCEVCGFDFCVRYGKLGGDYIEAHHLVPIAQLSGETLLTIKDLAMVCANCHRMLHVPPWMSVTKLRKLL